MVSLITTARSSHLMKHMNNSLLQNIPWKNDEAIVFGKHIITKRKTAWYGDSGHVYIYSNTEKKALPWTRELTRVKQVVENLSNTKFNPCLLNLYHDGNVGRDGIVMMKNQLRVIMP